MNKKTIDRWNVFLGVLCAILGAAVAFNLGWPHEWAKWAAAVVAAIAILAGINVIAPYESDGGPNL